MVKLLLVLRKRRGSLTRFQLGVGRIEKFLATVWRRLGITSRGCEKLFGLTGYCGRIHNRTMS